METISTVNSLIRTFIALLVCAAVGYGGWMGYSIVNEGRGELRAKEEQLVAVKKQLTEKDNLLSERQEQVEQLTVTLVESEASLQKVEAQVKELNVELVESEKRNDRLQTSLNFLKIDHRLAQLTVLSQTTDPDTREVVSSIEFVEINDEGAAIDEPRTFEIKGDLVYVDYWVVKFNDAYVEQAEVDRSTSICLFRRIFGEYQEPKDGFLLDAVGSRPTAYARGGQMSEFEKSIWDDFWNIANDPRKARVLGIRAAHGEAVSTRLRTGQKYRLHLRASGGLTITPV